MTLPEGAELGSTKDPKALIKGEPSEVDANAVTLSDEASRIGGIAGQFAGVQIPGWQGGSGSVAYASKHEAEMAKWTAYTELLTAASTSLSMYAGSLRTAQTSAQAAIEKWQQGEDATAAAVLEYNTAVDTYNAAQNQRVTIPTFGNTDVLPSAGPARPGPFQDPGAAMREEAVQILEDARKELDSAGASAVGELGGLEGARTESSSGPGADGKVEGPKIKWQAWEETFGRNPREGADGAYDNGASDSPFAISLGKIEGNAQAWGAKGEWEDYVGGVNVKADGSVTVAGVKGDAEASITDDGVVIGANGRVIVAGAEGSVSGEYGIAEGKLSGEASLGANAGGGVELGPTGVHANGELFAGAQAEVKAGGDVGGLGGEVKAEGWAGIGAGGDLDAGYDDGKLTIGGSGGLAFGIGGQIGGEVTIDVEEALDTGKDIVEGIGGLLS